MSNRHEYLTVNDFELICRFCLVASENLTRISMKNIDNMLKECTPDLILYYYDEKMPQQVCESCCTKLKTVYEFKQQCSYSMKCLCDILLKQENNEQIAEEVEDSKLSIKTELNSDGLIDSNELKEKLKLESDQDEKDNNIDNDFDDEEEIKEDADYDYCDDESIEENKILDNENKSDQKQSLTNLLIKKYKIYDLTCNICNKEICSRQTLLRHMRTHDKNRTKKYQCDFCDKKFFEAIYMEKHIKIKHVGERKYQCDLCPKKYYHLNAFGIHYKQTHKIKPSVCKYCNREFNHPIQLKQHEESKHVQKEFICDTCGKNFPRRWKLKEHQSVHSEDRPFACNFCESRFKQNVNLQTHIRIKHSDTPTREMCFKCGVLVRPGQLGRHLESHNENNVHKCEICERTYRHRFILQRHIQKEHMRIKTQYFCDICEKSLSSKTSLKDHMNFVHSQIDDNRRAECHICGQVYKRISSVREHIRSAHMDQRPHSCPMCKRTFHRSDHLRNHIRTHTGEKPSTCPICGKSYGRESTMKDHVKKMHGAIVQKN